MGGSGEGDTGGNDGSTGGDSWNDENIDGLWGWLSSLVSGLESIWQAVTNLPGLIAEKVAEAIKGIFIPDADYIETSFASFLDELKMKFNLDTSVFQTLFNNESAVTDIETEYNIPGVGNFNLKLFDASFFVDGVTYFRPFIRGFLVLLMLLFHVKQLVGFFGYDAGYVQGRQDWGNYMKGNNGGHKE